MQSAVTQISPWQLFLLGGPLMWPILLCSVFASAVVVEKFAYFSSIKIDVASLKERIFDAVRKNDIKNAVLLCEEVPSPAGKVLRAGLLKFGSPKEDVVQAMEEASEFEWPALEKRLSVLSAIGNIAPLLGLLGTVLGMCSSFHTVQVRALAMDLVTPGDIAGGVWQALITTAAGLFVAIPAYMAYNYFIGRVNDQVLQMEKAAADVADLMAHFSIQARHERS